MCYKIWQDGKFIEIDEPHELATRVQQTLTYYKEKMDAAVALANRNSKEIYDDAQREFQREIDYLKEDLRFSVARLSSEKELEAYNNFVNEHLRCRTTKATGGKMPWIMQTANGIGASTIIRCPVCGEEENITDTSVW